MSTLYTQVGASNWSDAACRVGGRDTRKTRDGYSCLNAGTSESEALPLRHMETTAESVRVTFARLSAELGGD